MDHTDQDLYVHYTAVNVDIQFIEWIREPFPIQSELIIHHCIKHKRSIQLLEQLSLSN